MGTALAAIMSGAAEAAAQHHGAGDTTSRRTVTLDLGAQGTWAATHVSAAPGGQPATEGFLTQPLVTVHASALGGAISVAGELNFEGVTLRRGELTPGVYGESYFDRRHPHTFFHDVVVTARTTSRRPLGFDVSLSAGRGFAPFGTDDPMSRPFLKFPVNHHLAQLLERVVVVAALRRTIGPAALVVEGGTFNGDEPVGPFAAPRWERFGDSWAGRLTVVPLAGVELQASRAFVKSPERADCGHFDQRKLSASVRYENVTRAGRPYALVEWARTQLTWKRDPAFSVATALAEGALTVRGVTVATRVERTERPEEERTIDLYRTPRPPIDLLLIGITRWDVVTARVSRNTSLRGVMVTPFLEAARARPRATIDLAPFQPESAYGARVLWTVTAGLRATLGGSHPRMGRYGVAVVSAGNGLQHQRSGQAH